MFVVQYRVYLLNTRQRHIQGIADLGLACVLGRPKHVFILADFVLKGRVEQMKFPFFHLLIVFHVADYGPE